MRLTQITLESKEVATIVAHPINKLVRHKLERFQKLCNTLYTKVFADTDQKLNYENILELEDELSEFSDLPYIDKILAKLKLIGDNYKEGENAKERSKSSDIKSQKKKIANDLEAAFLSGDIESIGSISDMLSGLLAGTDKINFDVDANTREIMKYAFTKGDMSFFNGGSDSVLSTISPSDYKRVADINLDKNCYTYVDFPRAMFDSIEYVMGFMFNLTDGPNPKRINSLPAFRKHTMVANANSEPYKKLMSMVDSYLTHNDRKQIQPIMDELQKFPELVRLNNKLKRDISTVYRGVPDHDNLRQSEVLKHDKNARYVATSLSHYVALNFAKAKGHLDREANVSGGWMLEYNVTPEAILLVTEILGTKYGESEILIDSTKATDIDIEYLDFDEYHSGDEEDEDEY